MAADPALEAFLVLDDGAVATYADARAQALNLPLPSACRPGVIENLSLLRRQTAVFVAGLDVSAPDPPEAFEP